MSLPESVRNFQGQLLCFRPFYGWGWYRHDTDGDKAPLGYAEVDRAGDFHIRVHRFFAFRGELRGLVGRVEQAQVPLYSSSMARERIDSGSTPSQWSS